MKRKTILSIAILLLIPFIIKAEWVSLNKKNTTQTPPDVTLISDDNSSSVLKIEISGFDLRDINSDGHEYQIADLLTESFVSNPGFPALPYIAKVLAIPDQAAVSVEILETGDIQTFRNIYIPPARTSWFEGDPETPYLKNTKAYGSNSIYPNEFVKIDPPAIFRDFRIARISVFPVRYIPAAKELQVVTSITIRINYGPGEVINPRTTSKKPIAPSFAELYRNFIFNYQGVLDDSYGGKENGHELMLCIMPDDFVASFQMYADWKRQSGIDIHITKFSDINANATDPDIIKNHIADAYYNWEVPPTYVLLVGDDGIFPKKIVSYDYSFPNEDFFVEIDGDDYFPEMMIGRFTNESDYGLQVMINKFQKYEKTPYTTSTDWFKKGICCSNDAYASQVETKRFAADQMLQYGNFTSVDTMMNASPCNYELSDVINAINDGRSFLNYRGEGWSSGWWASCTSFSTSDVSSLSNGQKFTFVTSIGCGVAMFNTSGGNCFGEEWIETGTLSGPKGAAAFVGPTSNTHTTYNNKIDKGIYTGMFPEGMETPGQGLLRGKLYMYNIFGNEYWVEYHYRVYCILGDPSIHIWKDIPQAVTVNYPASISFGTNLVEFTVNFASTSLPVADALVCVTGDNIFETGYTDASGKAYINITAEAQDTLTVTVRGGNVIPFMGTMEVIPPDGPWVVKDYFLLNDTAGGNGNGLMDYGESILLSLAVKNIGTIQADNVYVSATTTDPYITLSENNYNYGNIAAGQTILATDVYSITVANDIPDEHEALVNIAATDGNDIWNSSLSLTGYAPVLTAGTISISDPGGNDNGRLDPGETVTITAPVINDGHSLSPSASAILTTSSPYITINSGSSALGQIAAASSANAVFNITCSSSTPIGQSVDLVMNITAGNYGFDTTYYITVGLLVEDWELGNFTRFPWTFSGNTGWVIVDAGQYEGIYTSKSGVIQNNETSSMSLQLLVDIAGQISFYRKVSSESNYDYLRFYIDGIQQAQWSGEVDWGEVNYDVTAGIHTFKWTYDKDNIVSSGTDCAWVDYIVFPPSTVIAPEISVTPASFTKTILLNGSANDILNIANSGNTDLNFTAEVVYSANSDELVTVYPSNFSYATGSCTSSAKTEVSLVKGYPPYEVGWMKFDVSGIPDGSTINSVEFHGYVNDNYYPYWSITPVTNDPVAADASVLYADISDEANSGYYLHRTEPGTLANDWISHTLGGNVNTDLENALAQNWFAIGIVDTDNGTYYIGFDGWNEANIPYLVIDYTYMPTETWLNIDGGTAIAGSVAPENNQDINISFEAGSYSVGTYQANIKITNNDPDEALVMIPCTMIITHGMNVSLTAILEGPFNGSAMSTGINGILPINQPYNTAPWNYTGTESVAVMPANAVDWVLVELRDTTSASNATPATRIARQAGLLLSNGNIVATDGSSPLLFNDSVSNGLFVVIHHRNHLAVLSAGEVTLSGGNYTYDFTTAAGQAFGTGSQKQLAADKWGMMSGDANANGIVGNEDLTPAWDTNAGKAGYYPADLNLDRQVDNHDKDNYWLPNMGEGTNVPQ